MDQWKDGTVSGVTANKDERIQGTRKEKINKQQHRLNRFTAKCVSLLMIYCVEIEITDNQLDNLCLFFKVLVFVRSGQALIRGFAFTHKIFDGLTNHRSACFLFCWEVNQGGPWCHILCLYELILTWCHWTVVFTSCAKSWLPNHIRLNRPTSLLWFLFLSFAIFHFHNAVKSSSRYAFISPRKWSVFQKQGIRVSLKTQNVLT